MPTYSVFTCHDEQGNPRLVCVTAQLVRGRVTTMRGQAVHKIRNGKNLSLADLFARDLTFEQVKVVAEFDSPEEAYALKFAIWKEHTDTLLCTGRGGTPANPESALVKACAHRRKLQEALGMKAAELPSLKNAPKAVARERAGLPALAWKNKK